MDQESPTLSQTTLLENFYTSFVLLLREAYSLFSAAVQSEFFSYFEGIAPYLNILDYFSFDELQIKLLKAFLLILFINTILILITWKIYGKRISNRFMKTATSKTIEELKKSASMLKLPKEHNPRV